MHKNTVKLISVSAYEKKMSKVIRQYSKNEIDECLIALLDEAVKWRIKNDRKKSKINK